MTETIDWHILHIETNDSRIKSLKGRAVMQEKTVLSVKEAAKLLGVSPPTFYVLCERADFDALVRIGKRKLILRHRLMDWLENQATQGKEVI